MATPSGQRAPGAIAEPALRGTAFWLLTDGERHLAAGALGADYSAAGVRTVLSGDAVDAGRQPTGGAE